MRTLLHDSGLSHSYWAEAASYSVFTRNLIPSRHHPGAIPLQVFTGRHQTISHLRVFGAKCWAKVPTVHGAQVMGGSKLDPRSVKCHFLGYAGGSGNYRVQDVLTRCVLVSRDVVFEEGQPCRTSPDVGKNLPLFDVTMSDEGTKTSSDNQQTTNQQKAVTDPVLDDPRDHRVDIPTESITHDHHTDIPAESIQQSELRRSSHVSQPSVGNLQSREYEETGRDKGEEWTTNRHFPQAGLTFDRLLDDQDEYIACLVETKASHSIPRSYRHSAMSTDPDRWMIPMKAEIETLKAKHTWDLVKPPSGANIMDSMWVYDIKWDGEGNRIKDKARVVGKGYTQQLGIDYNETWAGVTWLESVRMTATIAAKHDLKLWRIDFVGAYLNSLTKEDIYMKQPEGFIQPGFEDYVCKLVHTIYGTMQGAHDWYKTLTATYEKLGYTTSHADPCVRFKTKDDEYTVTDTYTDNVFGASKTDAEII